MHSIYRLLCVCYVLCIMSRVLAHAEELFLQGNKEYHAGVYTKALEYYEKIASPTSVVLYNKGNCLYKLNRPLEALIWWSRAEKNVSLEELRDIYTNKAKVYAQFSAQIPQRELRSMPLYIFILQITILFLWVILVIGLYFLCGLRRFLYVMILAGVVCCVGERLYQEYRARSVCYGYVRTDKAALYAGPGTWHSQVILLSYASYIEIIKKSGEWHIVNANGVRGWIQDDEVAIV